jgi:hypothetical protein
MGGDLHCMVPGHPDSAPGLAPSTISSFRVSWELCMFKHVMFHGSVVGLPVQFMHALPVSTSLMGFFFFVLLNHACMSHVFPSTFISIHHDLLATVVVSVRVYSHGHFCRSSTVDWSTCALSGLCDVLCYSHYQFQYPVHISYQVSLRKVLFCSIS